MLLFSGKKWLSREDNVNELLILLASFNVFILEFKLYLLTGIVELKLFSDNSVGVFFDFE